MGCALVTGGARGLGLEIARAMQRAGHVVAVCDIDEHELERSGRHEHWAARLRCDVSDRDDVRNMFGQLEDSGLEIDILVNNAGTSVVKPFLELGLADWRRVIDVNLTGAFHCAQCAAAAMQKSGRGGRIVNITSVSAQRGGVGRAAYGASKGGLEALTKIMAVELAEFGITCNAVAPGPVATDLARDTHSRETVASYERRIPLKRYGTTAEVASAVVYLASDAASYVTGHVLNVDGGFSSAGLLVERSREPND